MVLKKEAVVTDKAPKALGPYSAGIKVGHFVYSAGQIGMLPETGELVEGGIQPQTRQALTNLKNVLAAAGSSLDQVVKTTVFLQDMGEFSQMNEVYASFFTAPYPARSAVQAAALPKGAAVEIEVIAMLGD